MRELYDPITISITAGVQERITLPSALLDAAGANGQVQLLVKSCTRTVQLVGVSTGTSGLQIPAVNEDSWAADAEVWRARDLELWAYCGADATLVLVPKLLPGG